MIGWLRGLLARPSRPPAACPYCPNADRRSVLEGYRGCQYDRAAAAARGIVGSDPPCVCDGFFTRDELSRHLNLGW